MKELSFQRNCGAASVGECNKVMWYFQLKILFLKRKIYMCIQRKLNTSRFYMLKKLLVTVCSEASSISQPQFKPCFVPLTFGNVSILWPLKLHLSFLDFVKSPLLVSARPCKQLFLVDWMPKLLATSCLRNQRPVSRRSQLPNGPLKLFCCHSRWGFQNF